MTHVLRHDVELPGILSGRIVSVQSAGCLYLVRHRKVGEIIGQFVVICFLCTLFVIFVSRSKIAVWAYIQGAPKPSEACFGGGEVE